jgi:hypothetical protein
MQDEARLIMLRISGPAEAAAGQTSRFRQRILALIKKDVFLFLLMYFIQHCFICCPSDSTVSSPEVLGSNPVI